MLEMSGKCKSNPIKTNNLIYIMIFFLGGGVHKKKSPAPLYRILIYAPDQFALKHVASVKISNLEKKSGYLFFL